MITHLELVTHKLTVLAEFYANVLDLPVKKLSDTRIEVQAGATQITFVQTDEVDPAAPPMYHFAFNIPENKIELAADWSRNKGLTLLTSPDFGEKEIFDFIHWNAHSVYFYDPGGNQVEFIARHDLKNGVEGEFSSKDILSVSEIGLVVDDVLETVEILRQQTGLLPFRKPYDTFAAVGTDHALFILALRNRIWLATDVPSRVFPTVVGLDGSKKISFELEGFPYTIFASGED